MPSARTAATGSLGCARRTRTSGPPSQTVPVIGAVWHQNTSASPSLPRTDPGGSCQLAIHASGMASPSAADSWAAAAVPGPRSIASAPMAAQSSTWRSVRASSRMRRAGCRHQAVSSNTPTPPMIRRAWCAKTGAAATATATVSGTAQGSRKRDFMWVANIQNASCATSIAPSAMPWCRMRISSATIAALPIQNAMLHCGSHGSLFGAVSNPYRNAASRSALKRVLILVPGAAA